MITLVEIHEDMQRFSKLLDRGIDALRDEARNIAAAERDYRKARAEAYLRRAREGTVDEKKAYVDADTADLRYERDVAEGMRTAALEAVRSRRTQLSAAQTMANAYKADADLARTGPQ